MSGSLLLSLLADQLAAKLPCLKLLLVCKLEQFVVAHVLGMVFHVRLIYLVGFHACFHSLLIAGIKTLYDSIVEHPAFGA